jgi:AraC family transcriptional regulator
MKLDPIQKNAIIPNESGIIKRTGSGFHVPSPFAREHLCYVLWSDEYFCNPSYHVSRSGLETYILMFLKEGVMEVQTGHKVWEAQPGTVILLDGKQAHSYRAKTDIQVGQYMINGNAIPAYCDLLTSMTGPLFTCDSKLSYLFSSLTNELNSNTPDDHLISMLLSDIFYSLIHIRNSSVSTPVENARRFMQMHYTENLTLDDIARHASLSKYYFTRLYQKETGYTPWEFLTQTRLRHAMQILSSSSQTIESIATACGFSGATPFIRVFKKATGFTPDFFRKFFTDVEMDSAVHPGGKS